MRAEIPDLLAVAREVGRRPLVGVAAYEPANSHPEKEAYVFDFVGMLGLPLVPCHEFPTEAPAACFSVDALKDPAFASHLQRMIRAGKPVLLTDGLVARLTNQVDLTAHNVQVLPVKGDPKSLLALPEEVLDRLRQPLLRPLQTSLRAPNQVGLCLFQDGSWVIENFADQLAAVELDGRKLVVEARGWQEQWE